MEYALPCANLFFVLPTKDDGHWVPQTTLKHATQFYMMFSPKGNIHRKPHFFLLNHTIYPTTMYISPLNMTIIKSQIHSEGTSQLI